MRWICAVAAVASLWGCSSLGAEIETLVSNTPVYNNNRVFYLEPIAAEPETGSDPRYQKLLYSYEIPQSDRDASIKNGDPVAITISRAYVPFGYTRQTTSIGGGTRDIAVLLDVAAKPNQDGEYIAVWYQRNVPEGSELTFENLLVYSQDTWDNRVPPYFRLRLVDVSNERNTATGELLKLIGNSTDVTSSLFAGGIGTSINAGVRAAELVLANQSNVNLLDFSFNLYSTAQIEQAGGMPLGAFRAGGMLLMGYPGAPSSSQNQRSASAPRTADAEMAFWEQSYTYDNRLRRTVHATERSIVQAPYILATVIRADALVPNVVKERTIEITKKLTDPAEVSKDIQGLISDTQLLAYALQGYSEVEKFSRNPTRETFAKLVAQLEKTDAATTNDRGYFPDREKNWFFSILGNASGQRFGTFKLYGNWVLQCADHYDFNFELRRFVVKDKEKATQCEATIRGQSTPAPATESQGQQEGGGAQ